ncbi:MAG TPA: alpha/beta hydrolase [Acidimicrobiales bacterium]|nr:alpha/beta hydrolase [Acidimicrobiales bacterium]
MTSEHDTTPNQNHPASTVHAVLVPGWWLGGWAWAAVEPGLRTAGITPHAVTLPGLDGTSSADITLDDHVAAVVRVVDALAGEVVLVGHSGGGAVVQSAADRRPDRIRRVVYVDSGPLRAGESLRPDATVDVELPSWDELAAVGSSIDGIDDDGLVRFRERAVPHPAGVARAAVDVRDPRRLDVPASVICTSLPSSVLSGMIEAGEMPSELPDVRDVRYVDLPTGHWPMFSRPTELAEVLADEIMERAPVTHPGS